MSPVPGGVSITKYVDARPVGVLDELGDRLLDHETAPQQRLVLVGEQSHREQADRPRRPPGARGGPSCRRARGPRRRRRGAGEREAPDVGVEHADDAAGQRQGHRQVGRDRRLADAALARRDDQHRASASGSMVWGARAWARARARAHELGPARGASITSMTTSPRRRPRWPRAASRTSRSIWPRRGQAAVVRATSTRARPPSTSTAPTMPRSMMERAQLGVEHVAPGAREGRRRPSRGDATGRGAGAIRAGSAATMGSTCQRRAMSNVTTTSRAARRGARPDHPDRRRHRQGRRAHRRRGHRRGPGPARGGQARRLLGLQLRHVLRLRVRRRRRRARVLGTSGSSSTPASADLLTGSTLDYTDRLQGAGFHITNPNATRTCGCGNSFS